MNYAFLSLFAVLAFTTAMCYEPDPVEYSLVDQQVTLRLAGSILQEPLKGRYRSCTGDVSEQ